MAWYGVLTVSQVNQEDLMELLGKAVTCAVLGKAGPQRSRVLGLLYKVKRYFFAHLVCMLPEQLLPSL